MDIISHLPGLSEDHKIPYVFVASKEELGHASSTKRPTSCVMICPNMKRKKVKQAADKMEKDGDDDDDDYRELYDEVRAEVYTIVSRAFGTSFCQLVAKCTGRIRMCPRHNSSP